MVAYCTASQTCLKQCNTLWQSVLYTANITTLSAQIAGARTTHPKSRYLVSQGNARAINPIYRLNPPGLQCFSVAYKLSNSFACINICTHTTLTHDYHLPNCPTLCSISLYISSASFLFNPAFTATASKSSFVGSMLSFIEVV